MAPCVQLQVLKQQTVVSEWFEPLLKPWRHYVPLDSPHDVAAKLQWCREHPESVRAIVTNATAYMQQFADEEEERSVLASIVRRYAENVVFI